MARPARRRSTTGPVTHTAAARHSVGHAATVGLTVASAGLAGVGLAVARLERRDVAVLELGAAAGLLVAFLVVRVRRQGVFSPGSLITAALLAYLPLRGLPLLLGRPGAEQGVNPRVVSRLGDDSAAAEAACFAVLVIALSFLVGYALLTRGLPARDAPAANENAHSIDRESLGPLSPALMLVGVAALGLQAVSSLTYLREGSIQGGFLTQLWQTLSFCFGFGIVVAPRVGPREMRLVFLALLASGVGISVAAGSKDVLVQILVALAVRHLITGARRSRGHRSWLIGMAIVGTVTLIGFPSLNSYRRSVLAGTTATQGLRAIPRDLRSRTIVLGKARRATGVLPYLGDAGLYLSNRLHGFDSLLLGMAAPHDPTLLPVQTVLMSPLAVVLPGRFVDPGQRDIGLLFAHDYWGLPPRSPTHIAIGVFTQGWIAWSWPAVISLGAALGAVAFAADRCLATRRPGPAVVGYTLLLGALSMERDFVFVVTSTGKHLLLAALVLYLLRRSAREHARPKRDAAGAGVGSSPVAGEELLVHR